jgi:hypothetical protein
MQLCSHCRYDTFGIPRASIHGSKVARLPPITPKNGSIGSVSTKTYISSMARMGGALRGLFSGNYPPLAHSLAWSLSRPAVLLYLGAWLGGDGRFPIDQAAGDGLVFAMEQNESLSLPAWSVPVAREALCTAIKL